MTTVYVQRRSGAVVGVFAAVQPGIAEEPLADNHADVQAYRSPPPSQDDVDLAAMKGHAKLLALRSMTPAQVQAWVAANVTNLADARDLLTTLAVAVAVLSRRG